MDMVDPEGGRWLPFVGVLMVLLWTGLGHDPIPQVFAQQDKVQHVIGFVALAITLRRAFPALRFGHFMLAGLVLSGLIELGQELLPRRTPSLGDVAANLAGMWLGWGCSLLMEAWWKQRLAAKQVASRGAAD